jgi:hypothetical protein
MTKYRWRDGDWIDSEGNPAPKKSDGIHVPQLMSDLPAYYSVASNKWVEGRAARRDDLARTGCREVDPSEGPKYCHTKKWADRLRMDHQPQKFEPRQTVIGPEV